MTLLASLRNVQTGLVAPVAPGVIKLYLNYNNLLYSIVHVSTHFTLDSDDCLNE